MFKLNPRNMAPNVEALKADMAKVPETLSFTPNEFVRAMVALPANVATDEIINAALTSIGIDMLVSASAEVYTQWLTTNIQQAEATNRTRCGAMLLSDILSPMTRHVIGMRPLPASAGPNWSAVLNAESSLKIKLDNQEVSGGSKRWFIKISPENVVSAEQYRF